MGYAVLAGVALLFMVKVAYADDVYINATGKNLFPFIQAIGICFFKSSTDPLCNVSALSYLKLVSIN